MKFRFLFAIIFVSSFALAETNFTIHKSVLDGESVSFIKHAGSGPMDNYLSMNIPFEPVAHLFADLLIEEQRQLANRGESHITVVTPLEFKNDLKEVGITIQEIDQIAENKMIQSSQYEILCLGRGDADINNKKESTFYLVVKSDNLLAIREEIQKLFIAKGGNPEKFVATHFYPHITLGFTSRDLHESDNVIKDINSCKANVQVNP